LSDISAKMKARKEGEIEREKGKGREEGRGEMG
jgi:hypothetical protein